MSAELTHARVLDALGRLRLRHVAERLDALLSEGARHELTLLDFLDRVVIISTQTYAADEIKEILAIRAQEEEIDISADALALLTKIGAETGLRYAGNLLTTAHLIAKKRSPRGADAARPIEVSDVERVFRLFYDPARSVKFVHEFEKRLIGEDGVVSLSNQTNGVSQGGDAMEVS